MDFLNFCHENAKGVAQVSDTDSSLIILDVVEDKAPAFGSKDVEEAAKKTMDFSTSCGGHHRGLHTRPPAWDIIY